VYSNLNVI